MNYSIENKKWHILHFVNIEATYQLFDKFNFTNVFICPVFNMILDLGLQYRILVCSARSWISF